MKSLSWRIAYLANFLCLGSHLASTLLPLYWTQEGFSKEEIGWLAASFSLAAILSRFGVGSGLERWGRKPFLLSGGALLLLPASLYLWAGGNLTDWFGLRIVQGVGLGFYIPAILTWVADRSPPDQIGQLQGVFGVSGLLGSAAGPMVAERVYRVYGFSAMFQFLLACGLLSWVLLTLLPESRPKSEPESRAEGQGFELSQHVPMLLVTLPFGWLVGTIITFLAPYVEALGLPKVGLYFTGFAAASIAVRLLASKTIDRWTIGRLVMMSGSLLVFSGFALAALTISARLELLLLAAVLNGLGHGFLFPALSAYTVRRASSQKRASSLSLFSGVFDLGIFLGALASGYIAEKSQYWVSFSVAATILACSLPLFFVKNTERAR